MSQTKAQLLEPTGDFTLTSQLIGVGATFSGNVSIAGTLTKQDVTNVDSVGVVTARQGVVVPDGEGYKFGDGSYRIEGKDDGVNARIGFVAGGTERVRIDSNGDLNLGNNPTNQYGYKLNIQDSAILYAQTASSGGTELKLHLDNSTDLATFGTVSADNLALVTNNLERLRINSSGRVGIGTNNPSSQLDLSGTNTTVWPFTSDVSNVYAYSPYPHELQIQNHARDTTGAFAGIYFHSGASADGSYVSAARIAAIDSGNYKSDLAFGTRNTAFKERLRITAAGLVGIGTINPTRGPLHVHENSTGDVQIHLTNQETGTTSSDGFTIFSGANAGPNAGFVNRESGGTIAFYTHNGSSVGVRLTLSHTGNLTSTGAISDSKGELRSIPRNNQGSAYTLVASDVGKCITAGGNITVNNSIFSAGDVVSIIADTGSTISIVQGSGVTMYNTGDSSTGSKTLASRGMCTIWFVAANNCYLSGSGIS